MYEKKIRNRLFRLFLLLAIIFYIGDRSFFGSAKIKHEQETDYTALFNIKVKKDLNWGNSYIMKGRNPISCAVIIDQHQHHHFIYIYKINLLIDSPLTKFIKVNQERYLNIDRDSYQNVVADFEFKYLKDSVSPASQIYIDFNADSVQENFCNDSIIEYTMNFYRFSIGYHQDLAPDIFLTNKNGSTQKGSVSANICFVKKGTKLYFILMDNMHNLMNNNLINSMIN